MPRYVRAGIKLDRWLRPEWLGPDEIQADALADLRSDENQISVYGVDSDESIERIVVAFAAMRDDIAKIGYAVFDGEGLPNLGIQIVRTPGRTPDAVVNGLHHDLCHLTGQRLVGLATIIGDSLREDILPKRLKTLLKLGIERGHLDERKMNQRLLQLLKQKP